jgi:para-aminobenzoate synthetase component 1
VRLESGGPSTPWSRWSYFADHPQMVLRCDSNTLVTILFRQSEKVREWKDPLEALAWMASNREPSQQSSPPFTAGWVGWISYDFGRIFEAVPKNPNCVDDLRLPLFEFQYFDRVTAIDRHLTESDVRAEKMGSATVPSSKLSANFTREGYERAVKRAIDYIAAGDIFQVNLAQTFTMPQIEPAHETYGRLQREAGSSHGAFFPSDNYALICNSPELFLRVTVDPRSHKQTVVTRPIKGTRPRAVGMDQELRESKKDQAELNMIVDLERNDLGRICEIGSVKVTNPREIEAHPTVYHGVATIKGTLRDDVSFVDILRATFPGGSITGAPKIRAMQIIEELEPTRRGPYCGAIGFVSNSGHIEFNIAIRTMIATAGQIHIPVGAGIVADSIPAAEYEETIVKARAMFRALGISSE